MLMARLRVWFSFPIFGKLMRFLAPLAVYTAGIVYLNHRLPELSSALPPKHGSEAILTGIVFGWLMGFRTNAAYARWWEGRTLWGQLVNESRNLGLKSRRLLSTPDALQHMAELIPAFADALRLHLRAPRPAPGLASEHRPLRLAGEVLGLIYAEKAAGRLDGWHTLLLDEHAKKLMDVCGACERIKNTPLAASYSGLLRKGIGAYMLSLPWFVADDLSWLAVPAVFVVGYALIGVELIAETIENPFGLDGDDLPLEGLVETIRVSTQAAMA